MNDTRDIPVPATKAVAIKREGAEDTPRITAKGHGFNAEKILDIAFAEGVKVRQDKDLTDLLDAFEVESPVPLEALHAVSLILERVYAENRRMEGAGGKPAATSSTASSTASSAVAPAPEAPAAGAPPYRRLTPSGLPLPHASLPEDGNSDDQ